MTEERIIAYLLEELPEEEAERFEDECFAGENWPEQIQFVEEDLIDEYLRDELTPERRRRFEENYLTTDARVERVRMAAALLRHVDSHASDTAEETPAAGPSPVEKPVREPWFSALWGGRSGVPRAALSFALLLIVVSGAYVAYRFINNSNRTVVLLALTQTAGERGPGGSLPAKVKLPSDAGTLRVSLALPEDAQPASHYRVELEDREGKTESFQTEEHDARSVTVMIPAARLSRGIYSLRLYAITADGTEQRIRGNYLFSVE